MMAELKLLRDRQKRKELTQPCKEIRHLCLTTIGNLLFLQIFGEQITLIFRQAHRWIDSRGKMGLPDSINLLENIGRLLPGLRTISFAMYIRSILLVERSMHRKVRDGT